MLNYLLAHLLMFHSYDSFTYDLVYLPEWELDRYAEVNFGEDSWGVLGDFPWIQPPRGASE